MRNRYEGTLIMPPNYNDSYDFFDNLRSYLKFSFFMLLFVALLLILLWGWQPWFELKIVPVPKTLEEPLSEEAPLNSGTLLQSNVKIIRYVVRPGDMLSKIAARHGLNVTDLLECNHLVDANALRVGQRLKIPQRQNQ